MNDQENQEQKESTESIRKRKFLIGLFSIILIFSFISFIIYQKNMDSQNHFNKSRLQVVSAIKSSDLAQLEKLASTEFMIGQPGTDNGAIVNPKKVLPKLLQITKTTEWTDHFEDSDLTRYLLPKEGPHQLVFSLINNEWVWSGFLSVSEDDLAVLTSELPNDELKDIEYSEAPSEVVE